MMGVIVANMILEEWKGKRIVIWISLSIYHLLGGKYMWLHFGYSYIFGQFALTMNINIL